MPVSIPRGALGVERDETLAEPGHGAEAVGLK
jgi:hypothetical protein